jgi:[protein-PII] uridylyltransferase
MLKMIPPSKELRDARDDLLSRFSKGEVSEDFQEKYAEIVDQYFRRTLEESRLGTRLFKEKSPFAMVAVGGYGRKELCLHSDVDIMILFGPKIPKLARDLSDEFFFPLWDLGLDLGYATRTIKDCLSLSTNDFEVLTSMMDARFVCGDSPLFLTFMERLQKKVIAKKIAVFGRWLQDRDKIRMDLFGDASYLLEPHLKEGIGGLRDYHHMLWLAGAVFSLRVPRDLELSGRLSHREYEELREHLAFILLVRNHLHHLSGRKTDRLGFEHQEEIARRLGFKDKKGWMGVELFLGKLHRSMASVKGLHRSFVESDGPETGDSGKPREPTAISSGLNLLHNEIHFNSATAIVSDPTLLIKIFEQAALSGYALSRESVRLVREFLGRVDHPFRDSAQAARSFLNIVKADNAVGALEQMFETGFLEAFIPEFGHIRDRVQFDAYHTYPVGRHCLETVKQLKTLSPQREALLVNVLSELPDPEPLFLAALFHDIGKVEKNHSQKGATLAHSILERLGLPRDRREAVAFLIAHHLLLAETATRRDLDDEKVVVQCARTIGNVERLKMLYLLTWADARATGPKAWNEWIASLVQELFFKILHILEKKELATPQVSEEVENTKAEIRRFMTGRMAYPELERMFEIMSPRYLLNTAVPDIVDHLEMIRQLRQAKKDQSSRAFVLNTKRDTSEGCWEFTFMAGDRPGLFADLAGVLALHSINVLSANVYTWEDGTAVDILTVSAPRDPLHPEKTWKQIHGDLEKTFQGKISLSYRLGEKSESSILSPGNSLSHPPQVIVDNESSDFFTVIEVFADDRVGLLYLITRTLFDLRLDIHIAKIATKVDQVADVFYVRDLEGQKVEEKEQVEEIRRALLHQLR